MLTKPERTKSHCVEDPLRREEYDYVTKRREGAADGKSVLCSATLTSVINVLEMMRHKVEDAIDVHRHLSPINRRRVKQNAVVVI